MTAIDNVTFISYYLGTIASIASITTTATNHIYNITGGGELFTHI